MSENDDGLFHADLTYVSKSSWLTTNTSCITDLVYKSSYDKTWDFPAVDILRFAANGPVNVSIFLLTC